MSDAERPGTGRTGSGATTGATAGPGAPAARRAYRERLWPSAAVVLVALLLSVMAALIPVPYGLPFAIATFMVVAVLLGVALVLMAPVVEVADGELRAGRAHVPLALLGPVTPLDRGGMRTAQGPSLDARAYLLTRGWVPGGCRIELLDPADPTPYWLVSTRRPQRLAAVLSTDPRDGGTTSAGPAA